MFLAAALAAPDIATAAPQVLEETAKISSPDPTYFWPVSIAIDGDWLIASGVKSDPNSDLTDNSTWLYQRQSDDSWRLVRRLHQYLVQEHGSEPPIHVAMRGGVAVILKEHASWIFERSGTTWTSVPSPIQTDGMDAEVNGGTIVVTSGQCEWSSNAYRKGANGAWTLVRQTPPEHDPDYICENEDTSGDVDVASNGTTMAVASFAFGGAARVFEGPFGTPPLMSRITSANPGIPFGHSVAIEDDSLVGSSLLEPESWRREAAGQWVHSGSLVRPDQFAVRTPADLEMSGTLAVFSQLDDALHGPNTGSVSVFERDANGAYRYVARLLASDRAAGQYFGWMTEISDRRVAARNYGTQSIHIFDLPEGFGSGPLTIQDNFEDGDASDWSPFSTGTFTVATTSTSRVYRQTSVAGNATSVWNTYYLDQAVEADIKPTAFATTTGDKWFGLFARYTNAMNYYYVTLRNNNTLLLRRMVNGVFTTLDSASLPITLNRSYRVRLEAIGSRLRVYVDGRLLAEARDTTFDQGQPGIIMYKTRADYDNVLVSSNPRTKLASYTFDGNDSWSSWDALGSWSRANFVFTQSDVSGGARATTGVATDNQVVQARMRRIGSSGTNNWFGLATRYQDPGNYYYVTLRNNGTISLRKLLNGSIIELDTAQFTTASNTWYRVRFEAVGSYLRVYINDVLRLDAIDYSHGFGHYGPVMYRTAAQYDDIVAIEP